MQGREGWDDTSKWNAKRFTAGKPESVKTRYAGPFRVTVEIVGHFDGLPFQMVDGVDLMEVPGVGKKRAEQIVEAMK